VDLNTIMKNENLIEKLVGFAQTGKGRRLLNTLNKRQTGLAPGDLDRILTTYCGQGLPLEVGMLKKHRGIIKDEQYDALAEKVKNHANSEKLDDFIISLKDLLSSGMKMNPAKMEEEKQA